MSNRSICGASLIRCFLLLAILFTLLTVGRREFVMLSHTSNLGQREDLFFSPGQDNEQPSVAAVSTTTAPALSIPTQQQHRPVRVAFCREDLKHEGVVYRALVQALFPQDVYAVDVVDTDHGVVSNGPNADFLMCLGYFYPKNFTEHRTRMGEQLGRLHRPNHTTASTSSADVSWPPVVDLVPHTRDRPFQMANAYEAWDRKGKCRYDAMIVVVKQSEFAGCPSIFWPYYASSFFKRQNVQSLLAKLVQPPSLSQAKAIRETKTDFCAFIVQHCWAPWYKNNEIMVRVIFYDLLSQAVAGDVPVKSFGRCRNTEGGLSHKRHVGDTDVVVTAYRPFRFSLVFENTAVPGYITEKIMNGLLADTVPVYWGAPDVAEYVNVNRIIHCSALGKSKALEEYRVLPKPTNMQEAEAMIQRGRVMLREAMQPCINEVLELERDPVKYARKMAEPILPGNRLEGSHFDLKRVAGNIRSVMAAYGSPLVVE